MWGCKTSRYTEKLKTTIGGSIKYNIYEFIEFEKWDQENCEAHPKVLLCKRNVYNFLYIIILGYWNLSK